MKGPFAFQIPLLALISCLATACAGPGAFRAPAEFGPAECAHLFDASLESERATPISSVSVPEIRMTPYHDDLEYPVWAASMLPKDNMSQQGGYASFGYIAETIAGKNGIEVVMISTERFKQVPQWAPLLDWLGERKDIADAPEYRDRSTYWVTRPKSEAGKPLLGSKVETTFGLTWSEYSRTDIEGKSAEQIYNDPAIRLPEEKTLRLQVTRYLDSRDKGIALEFRAVSKDLATTPGWLRDEGLAQMIRGILEKMKDYPELYDKPVVTIYADSPRNPDGSIDPESGHRAQYFHWLKMTLQAETTPEDQPRFIRDKEGKPIESLPWWVIEVSPKTLEEVLLKRLKGGRTVSEANVPHPFKLPDGREAVGQAKATIGFDSDGNVTQATLQDETELEPGIAGAAGATGFWLDQKLVRISAIAKPVELEFGEIKATAPVGSTLEWDSPYVRAWLSTSLDTVVYHPNIADFARPYMISPEEWRDRIGAMRAAAARRASRITGSSAPKDPVFVNEMNKQARLDRKELHTPRLTRVVSDPSKPILVEGLNIEVTQLEVTGDVFVFRVAKDTPLTGLPGEVGLVAAQGTDLEMERTEQGLIWMRVCLAEGATVQGKAYPKGAVLLRLNGIVMELNDALVRRAF